MFSKLDIFFKKELSLRLSKRSIFLFYFILLIIVFLSNSIIIQCFDNFLLDPIELSEKSLEIDFDEENEDDSISQNSNLDKYFSKCYLGLKNRNQFFKSKLVFEISTPPPESV